MHLGLIAVLARSFSRIHRANLVNFGILPLTFADPADYERVEQGARLAIEDVAAGLEAGRLTVRAGADGPRFEALAELSDREREIVLAGGRLNLLRR